MLSDVHKRRLVERGLNPDLALRLGMRTGPGGEAILFDYIHQGRVHNTKIRRGKGNMPWMHLKRPLVLWNVDSLAPPLAPDEQMMAIVEGEFDGVALVQAGFTRVVSVPSGAPSGPSEGGNKRFEYLFKPGTDELLDDIAKFKIIVLAVDGDNPGQYLRDALAARLGDERCLWVQWPEGCKDANDALLKHGPQNLATMVWGAKRMWLDHVARLSDIPEAGPEEIYTLGDPMMDVEIAQGGIRLPRVGFVTISGPANHGKSTWARQLCWHFWRTYGAPFAITVFAHISVGRVFSRFAFFSARLTASTSWPSTFAITCQP